MLIPRAAAVQQVERLLAIHPVVALLGPRQCGKTTLARMISAQQGVTYFDLENPVDMRRLSAPLTVLEALSGLIIIDEIQRQPGLFELLRVLVDRPEPTARFLVLGSASPDLTRGASESLAGRIGLVDLAGFNLAEVGSEHRDRLWVRGGFPRSFLAEDDATSRIWREAFIRTFLERDIPQLGINIPALALRRFWTMVAHYHGQRWNAAEFARSLGSSEATGRRYLDILAGAYMVRLLPAWFENVGKRQVKAPKLYIRDTGILHSLLGLETLEDVQSHPKLGASWEGFVIEQILCLLGAREAYFWATQGGAELDLLIMARGRRYGFEVKYADAPGVSRSMRVALSDLALTHLWVVYPGKRSYDLDDQITALALADLPEQMDRLRSA